MDRDEIAPLVAEGLTQRAIGQRLGISQTNVRHWLRRYGLATSGRAPGPPRLPRAAVVPPPASPAGIAWTAMSPNQRGKIAEAKLAAALLQEGFEVLLPMGAGARYDLATEKDGAFRKVQVKGIRLDSVGTFNLRSYNHHRITRQRMPYEGIDDMGVYVPDVDRCFLIPLSDFVGASVQIRLKEPTNNQECGIRWGTLYEIGLINFEPM